MKSLCEFIELSIPAVLKSLLFSVMLVLLLGINTEISAYGLPDYLPNGSHPRIWLTPNKLTELQAQKAANSPEWQNFYNWCESNLNWTGYDVSPGTDRFGNWPAYSGYRGSGWERHIISYALAYKILNGIDQVKADQYANRAMVLLDGMLRGGSSGEEINGLVIIRMFDTNDRTNNTAEAAALIEQNPYIASVSYKNGYGVRHAGFATAVAYDWLYEKLSVEQKTNYQAYIYRIIDWVEGKRSKYNNGVLWKGVRYYEDTDGPCTGTTPEGETISCTTVSRTSSSHPQFGYAYDNPGDNFWAGFFITGMLGTIATYDGGNPDAVAYYNFVKGTWWESMLKSRWADPMEYKGGDPSEGWNYGWGINRDLWALRGLKTATGADVFSGITFPAEAAQALIHATSSNLTDVIPTGDWGSNRGHLIYRFPLTFASLLQSENDPLAPVVTEFLRSATYYPTTSAETVEKWEPLLWTATSTTAPLSTLPLDYVSVGNGTVDMRSTWDNTADCIHAAFLMKKDIPAKSHDNYDSGHFYIQRGNDRLFEDSPGHETWRHSVLYFGTKSQQAMSEVGASSPAVPYFESGSGYLYFKGDLTRAYVRDSSISFGSSAIVRHASNYIKSVLYLRPNFWVIHDVTQSGPQADNLSKTWYSQYPVNGSTGLSVDEGNKTVTSQVGNSKAFLKTLYPLDVKFLLDTVPTADTYGRVAMKPITEQEYDQFLHVIEAADKNQSTMTNTVRIDATSGNMRGVYISDPIKPANNWVAMFSADKDGALVAADISYVLPAAVGYPPYGYVPKHIFVDLPPQTTFTFIAPKSKNVTPQLFALKLGDFSNDGRVYTSSSQGVIIIEPSEKIQIR